MEQNIFPIKNGDFKEMKDKVVSFFSEVPWDPKVKKSSPDILSSTDSEIANKVSSNFGTGPQTVSIVEAMKEFSNNSEIMNESANKVLNTILSGFALGWALSKSYGKATGLEILRDKNIRDEDSMSGDEYSQLTQKNQTDSAVALFTAAHYIVTQLAKYRTEEVSARVIPKVWIPELSLIRKNEMIKCVLFYYHGYVTLKEVVSDEVSLIKMTLDYFNAVLDELYLNKPSLKYLEAFEGNSYELEGTDFKFRGFDRSTEEKVAEIRVREVRYDEIVGNRESKLETKRMVERLLTYNPKEGKNPMTELRGIVRTQLFMGIPGTGKTMLISATATELKERCKDLGIPFVYSPLNLDIVSKFQGESAEKMLNWFRPQNDPSKIVFAPIDDAESVFAKRDGKESSEGSNSVLKVSLTQTEGADAVWNGNSILTTYTNNWEIIDPAWLSRQRKRTFILGPQTMHDFLDQTYLFLSQLEKDSPGIVKFIKPQGYEYLTDQKMLVSYSSAVKEEDIVPKNEVLREIYHRISKQYDPLINPEFVATFAYELTKAFPKMWAARDMRNVYDITSDKIMDFDYPDEWWKDHAIFFVQPYNKKYKMLLELRNKAMNGLSLERILLQELVKYADTAVSIYQTADSKDIQTIVQHEKNRRAALRILESEKEKAA